jgi:hypothetical protein
MARTWTARNRLAIPTQKPPATNACRPDGDGTKSRRARFAQQATGVASPLSHA